MALAQAERGHEGLAQAFTIDDLVRLRGDFRNGHGGHGPHQPAEGGLVRRRIARFMEGSVPSNLRDAGEHKPNSRNLASIIRSHFGPDNGVDLELPPRDSGREPPAFD